MKTYTSITNKGLVAVIAKNKKEAYNKIKEAGFILNKGHVFVSNVHLDYTSGIKLGL